MILFLDASAFIKLYVVEPGSGPLRRALKQASAVFALDATYVEVRGALARAVASGMLRETVVRQARGDFEQDWQGVHAVAPDAAMLRRAAELAETGLIDVLGALNLAAAETIARQLPSGSALALGTGDAERSAQAASLGLQGID